MSDCIKWDGCSGPIEVSDAASRERDSAARIAALEAENAELEAMLRLDIAATCPSGERSPDGIETCPNCSERLVDLRRRVREDP